LSAFPCSFVSVCGSGVFVLSVWIRSVCVSVWIRSVCVSLCDKSGAVKGQGSRLSRSSLQFCASVCTWSVCAQCVDQGCLCQFV
jgi:hypothetical protein